MIREHPRFQKTAIIFISAIHLTDDRPPARLRDGRGRLRAGAGRAGGAARQGQGLRRALPQDARSSSSSTRSWSAASPSAPRSSKPRPRGCCRASSGRSLALAAGQMGSWDWDIAAESRLVGRGPVPHLRRRPGQLSCRRDEHPRAHPSRRLGAAAAGGLAHGQGPTHASRPNSACAGRMARCAGASARRRRASTRPAAWCASAASPSTSPSARRPRSGRCCWRARSIIAPATRSPSCSRSCG